MSLRTTTVCTHTTMATHRVGVALGQALQQLMPAETIVVALHGNLGAGKTLLTQGIAAGLGVTERVTSPTFVFVNEYATATDKVLVHIDSYRLSEAPVPDVDPISGIDDAAALEAFTFGFEEILAREDAIVVIEWAERLSALLPADHLSITLDYTPTTPDERSITLEVHGTVSHELLSAAVALGMTPLISSEA